MKNIIITPTFSGHFKFIEKYLKSFDVYAQDKDKFIISFTISQNEQEQFRKIIDKYPALNTEVLFFEDLLKDFGITEECDSLLRKYGKFSYQTLKKYYTMLHYKKDARFLVLDSESMLVKPLSVSGLFDNFFADPFISISHLDRRDRVSNFVRRVLENNALFGLRNDIWCLENFVWFYDVKILTDMFHKFGTPYEIIDTVHTANLDNDPLLAGVFEIEFYQNYVFCNHKRYKYRVVDVNAELDAGLSPTEVVRYMSALGKRWGGNVGTLERAPELLTKSNVQSLAEIFVRNKFNIIRCEGTGNKNYKLQKKFLSIVQPDILAASQEHLWGINKTLRLFIKRLIVQSTTWSRFVRHSRMVFAPVRCTLKWIWRVIYFPVDILMLVLHLLRCCIALVTK